MAAPELMKFERDFARPVHWNVLVIESLFLWVPVTGDDIQDGQEKWGHEKRLQMSS